MPDHLHRPVTGRLAILAGGGAFPMEVFEASRRLGFDPAFFALRGFADRSIWNHPSANPVDMLNPSELIAQLKLYNPVGVVLAGYVSRPNPSVLLSAFAALRHQDELKQVLGEGDDHVLSRVIRLLEDHGLKVLGVDAVAPDLLCPEGLLTTYAPDDHAFLAINTGLSLLDQLSPFDCGQATVCQGQRVLAIEGPEGTDAMIARTRSKRSFFRLSPRETAVKVLIKTAKRNQDRRADLPAIGPRTIQSCRKAGLSGIALGAGSVILIERKRMIAEANQAGLFIIGLKAARGPDV